MKHSAAESHPDYSRIARAIGWLHDHAQSRPSLEHAARHIGLSEYHFQRLFTRWAGVSPKRFQQFLTLEDAQRRLAETRSTFDLAAAVGLSGGSRLHDLFVTLEAMSPGEARLGGAGLDIRWGVHTTCFGPALIASTTRGICALHFVDNIRSSSASLAAVWPHANLIRDQASTAVLAQRIFNPLNRTADRPLSLLVKGSNFQIQVWRALLTLPEGAVTTYGDLAHAMDMPESARAVGSAVSANPLAWLIPCHRVIRATGALTGYRWGVTRKAAMLGWEAARPVRRPAGSQHPAPGPATRTFCVSADSTCDPP